MPIPPFHEWLAKRLDEVPDTMELAMQIARSGAAGVTLDGLRRVCGLPPETLQDILGSLVVAGQVVVLKVDGRMTYRAA